MNNLAHKRNDIVELSIRSVIKNILNEFVNFLEYKMKRRVLNELVDLIEVLDFLEREDRNWSGWNEPAKPSTNIWTWGWRKNPSRKEHFQKLVAEARKAKADAQKVIDAYAHRC